MKNEKLKIALAPLAFGFPFGKGNDKLHLDKKGRPDGGVERLNAGLKTIKNNTGESPDVIIQTAGATRDNPSNSKKFGETIPLSLSEQMHKYLIQYHPDLTDKFINIKNAGVWGTQNEIRTAIKILQRKYGKETPVVLYVSSNLGHLPRIWLYLKMYKPENYTVKFVHAKHHFGVKAYIGEIAKNGRDIIYFTRVLKRFLQTERQGFMNKKGEKDDS